MIQEQKAIRPWSGGRRPTLGFARLPSRSSAQVALHNGSGLIGSLGPALEERIWRDNVTLRNVARTWQTLLRYCDEMPRSLSLLRARLKGAPVFITVHGMIHGRDNQIPTTAVDVRAQRRVRTGGKPCWKGWTVAGAGPG